MNFSQISDSFLIQQTEGLVKKEREMTSQILLALSEIERRRIYLHQGYPSLLEFCVKVFKYSESAAYRRISAARLLKDIPEVNEKVQSGVISLSNLASAQSFLRREAMQKKVYSNRSKRDLVQKLAGKTRKQTEEILFQISPKSAPIREITQVVSANESRLHFTVSKEVLKKLDRVKEVLSHKKVNPSYEELFSLMADIVLKAKDPLNRVSTRTLIKKQNSLINASSLSKAQSKEAIHTATPLRKSKNSLVREYLPIKTRRHVWATYNGECQFQSSTSDKKCLSRHRIQIEHIQPIAFGGQNSFENLTLMCQKHNLLRAELAGLRKTSLKMVPR